LHAARTETASATALMHFHDICNELFMLHSSVGEMIV
jgi:hypothetical protein